MSIENFINEYLVDNTEVYELRRKHLLFDWVCSENNWEQIIQAYLSDESIPLEDRFLVALALWNDLGTLSIFDVLQFGKKLVKGSRKLQDVLFSYS